MFNPHIHQQQQQQQQQFHQHLRQLQQLFQQQPPPPPPPQPPPGHHVAHHHHQTPRAMPPQTAPPPRMVNLCQATQTTILAPNPMLQGALLMQQMQGKMRSFGMGGQQFRQFFAAGARSSLLGPVPMGMAIKSPMMGYPAARMFHPHARFHNNTATSSSSSSSSFSSITTTDAARQPDRKRDSEQMAAGSSDDQQATSSTNDSSDKTDADGGVGGADGPTQSTEEKLEEPAVKKQRTEGSEQPKGQCVVGTVTIADTDGDVLSSECNSNTEDSQPGDCIILEDRGSTGGSDVVDAFEEGGAAEKAISVLTQMHSCLSATSPSGQLSEDYQQVDLPAEEMLDAKDSLMASPDNQEEEEEGVADGANKFYCYLCGITCHNQQNFRSHMNSMSHQQRMMEIQHMSNACLVTLLPRVQESLQGAIKDGEKKADKKHWCSTCHTHFTCSITDHRRTEEHKLASRAVVSSCTVCKKHFRTSQIFVEHLQSQEHRQKVEKLQEEEGCEALGNLTATDADGFSLDEVEGSEVEEGGEETGREEGDKEGSDKEDGWSSLKEVTLKNMTNDEQYDPDTVYGSSFFVPVAGFICRLCNKFYHFESSALHSHCKSLRHFENLKRHRDVLSQKGDAAESSKGSPLAADSLRPVTDTATDAVDETSLFDDAGSVINKDSMQPSVTLTHLDMQTEDQQHKQDLISASAASASSTDQDFGLASAEEETTLPLESVVQESPAEAREEADEEEEVEEEVEEEEKAAPVGTGKKSGAKNKPKRRSGRAASRR
ncbi:cdkn1a interacting zinc finger protein 1a [Labrus mixtus]|uniref:cdkn1a interacting zinc finger protein 1a n=1 Tax=Labrus mixtus TaxID=508554 RepID=UPI0029C0E7CE|nr:cdkn1a interacting zinc finger protein 1a [Labrus mixtus]